MRRRLLPASLVLLAWAHVANAQSAEATVLFEAAQSLRKAGNWAEACPKYVESQRLDPTISTAYWVAECHANQGRTASAWALFEKVASEAKTKGDTAKETRARERAAELAPKLTRVVVLVSTPELAGLVVVRGDAPVSRASWGLAVPVDPDKIRFRASAPSRREWSLEVDVVGEGKTLEVTVPPLEPATSPLASPPTAPPPSAGPTREPHRDSGASVGTYVGLGVGAAGVLAIGGSGVMMLVAKSNYSSARSAHCVGLECDAEGKAQTDRARSLANAATFVFVAGALSTVVGGVLVLVSPPKTRESVGVAFGVTSVSVVGRF